jgi:hypothetical protein
METKTNSSNNAAANTRAKNLTCWRTDTSPQCLRVNTGYEVHVFPYGYFQHAKFSRRGGNDVVQIQFHERLVTIKGKGLEPLCDALERLAVVSVQVRPEKYAALNPNAGVVATIEIVEIGKEKESDKP